MSIGAELGQYILQTQFKQILKIQWGGGLNAPSGYAGGLTYSYGKSGQPAEVNVWSTRQ